MNSQNASRQAYLIMAHTDLSLLNNLIQCLDFEYNDIYIHIDKKSLLKISDIKVPEKSGIFFIPSQKVYWGGDTQIDVTLNLMDYALNRGRYSYLHLLSGSDLPLRPAKQIYEYFEESYPTNFISVDHKFITKDQFYSRIGAKHFLQNKIERGDTFEKKLLKVIDRGGALAQRAIGIDRMQQSSMTFKKGSNWFSITGEMASYVMQNREVISKLFYKSVNGDEVFLQTICYNSPFKNTIADNNLRMIDWNRGGPYIWRSADYEELIKSDKMFARKFNSNVDNDIIEKIVDFDLS